MSLKLKRLKNHVPTISEIDNAKRDLEKIKRGSDRFKTKWLNPFQKRSSL